MIKLDLNVLYAVLLQCRLYGIMKGVGDDKIRNKKGLNIASDQQVSDIASISFVVVQVVQRWPTSPSPARKST
jgi:hypothetical protein